MSQEKQFKWYFPRKSSSTEYNKTKNLTKLVQSFRTNNFHNILSVLEIKNSLVALKFFQCPAYGPTEN